MAGMTESVREALRGVTYERRNAPSMESPQGDNPMIDVLITDPVHCTARHVDHDIQSVVASAMCGLVEHVPTETFERSFTHLELPLGTPDRDRDADWYFKEELDDSHLQGVFFLAMAGWMVIVKPVDDLKGNYIYIEKRWRAALTGLDLTDRVCTEIKKILLNSISEAMNRSRAVKEKFIRMFISLDTAGELPVEAVKAAVISQIKMVWEYHGMCSYRLMDELIFIDSPILGIETIAREACAFKVHYDALKTKMGVHFPYSSV